MRFDFSAVDDVDSYVFVPEGEHVCRVADVREGTSRSGSVRWSFRLEVVDGEWAGRTAAWDQLTWDERGVYRVKKILEALGLDTRGEIEVEPQDLLNLTARVRVVPEEREDPVTGRRQVRMRVPYLGYTRIEPEEAPKVAEKPTLANELLTKNCAPDELCDLRVRAADALKQKNEALREIIAASQSECGDDDPEAMPRAFNRIEELARAAIRVGEPS